MQLTIDLPEPAFARLSHLAELTNQSLSELVIQSVAGNLPPAIDTAKSGNAKGIVGHANVISEANQCCEYCQTQQRLIGMPLVIDHIIPRSMGGSGSKVKSQKL